MDIEKRLCERAEEVCLHLLPKGRRLGAEFVCGSVAGEAGDSLKVNLGGKIGVWKDFAGDKGGKTLMSLWCSVRSQAFKVCIVEAKEFLGIRNDFEQRVRNYSEREGEAPERRGNAGLGQAAAGEESAWKGVGEVWGRCEALTQGGPVWNYLVNVRSLAPEVIELYGVREMVSKGAWVMVFPYFVPREREEVDVMEMLAAGTRSKLNGHSLGEVAEGAKVEAPGRSPSWLKFERLDRPGGKKLEWTSRGPEKCLFGMPVSSSKMFGEAAHLLICEGEKDALSWASYGCGAPGWAEGGVLPVSVPFGAKWKAPGRGSPNREWLDRCWDWMQGFQSVFVAMDGDEAGRRAAADIITEIGPRRCRLVELPAAGNRQTTIK